MQLVLEETGTYSMSSDLPVLPVNMSVIIQPMGTLQRSWEKTWPGSLSPAATGKNPLTPQGLGSSGTSTLKALLRTRLSPSSPRRVEERSSPSKTEVWALQSSEGWDVPKPAYAEGDSAEWTATCFKSRPQAGSKAWLCCPADQFTSSLHGTVPRPCRWGGRCLSLQLTRA